VTQSPSSDAAFRIVFDERHDAVHLFCLRRLGADDANDATAEVFLVAWRRMDSMPERDETLPWLYGVARNVVRNNRRRRQRTARLVSRLSSHSPEVSDAAETVVVQNAESVEVLDAMAGLRPAEQEVLRLKAWEELSNEKIGVILGMSDRTVEGRYARALKKLAGRLPKDPVVSPRFAEEGGRV
jgi:RNA polymerase sigma factor (sigma-70 family)